VKNILVTFDMQLGEQEHIAYWLFNKPKSDSSKPNSKKPNNGGNGTGPRRGGSKKPAAKTDENAQNPWAKRQSVGGTGQRRRRPANND